MLFVVVSLALGLPSALAGPEALSFHLQFWPTSPTSKRVLLQTKGGDEPITLFRFGGEDFVVKSVTRATATSGPAPTCTMTSLPAFPNRTPWAQCSLNLPTGAKLTLDLQTEDTGRNGAADVNTPPFNQGFPPSFPAWQSAEPPAEFNARLRWLSRKNKTFRFSLRNVGDPVIIGIQYFPQGFKIRKVMRLRTTRSLLQSTYVAGETCGIKTSTPPNTYVKCGGISVAQGEIFFMDLVAHGFVDHADLIRRGVGTASILFGTPSSGWSSPQKVKGP